MKQNKEAGDTETAFEVGRKLVEGDGTGSDPEAGKQYIGKAPEKGRKTRLSPAKGEPGHYRQIAI